jgi:streptomycin 6-kinase
MKTEKPDKNLTKMQKAKEDWNLLDDGEPVYTKYNLLQPVRYENLPAMLKIPLHKNKQAATSLLLCWNGKDAVKVLRFNTNALLMERLDGKRFLKHMLMTGQEDEANDIICRVVNRLHSSDCKQVPDLVPLPEWFRSLTTAAENYGGLLDICHKSADALLADPLDRVALHGDIHYDNIIDSGSRGWVAIDPKGLVGERGFDFANIFCNPDLSSATAPGRLSRQSKRIAKNADIEVKRLLHWIVAWAGLSASWSLEDGENPTLPMTVARIAIQELTS